MAKKIQLKKNGASPSSSSSFSHWCCLTFLTGLLTIGTFGSSNDRQIFAHAFREDRIMLLLRSLCQLPEVREFQPFTRDQRTPNPFFTILSDAHTQHHFQHQQALPTPAAAPAAAAVWNAPSISQITNMIKSNMAAGGAEAGAAINDAVTPNGETGNNNARLPPPSTDTTTTASIITNIAAYSEDQHQRLQIIKELCKPIYDMLHREQEQQAEEMRRWREYQRWLPGFKGFFIKK